MENKGKIITLKLLYGYPSNQLGEPELESHNPISKNLHIPIL